MLPLEGLRVIDLSEVWAGPFSASLLGDLGAQVIKLESYPRAPQTRPTMVPANPLGFAGGGAKTDHPWDRSGARNMANRNKYGITLNLRTPRGNALFKTFTARVWGRTAAGWCEGDGIALHVETSLHLSVLVFNRNIVCN